MGAAASLSVAGLEGAASRFDLGRDAEGAETLQGLGRFAGSCRARLCLGSRAFGEAGWGSAFATDTAVIRLVRERRCGSCRSWFG